eukprot:gene26455-17555_t
MSSTFVNHRPAPNSALYIDESKRFSGSAVEEEAARKRAQAAKKEVLLAQKGAEDYHRNADRWQRMENATSQHEQRLTKARDDGTGCQANRTGAGFNIITSNYNTDDRGQKLQYQDQKFEYKHMQRLQNLYSKRNNLTHNIITGELKQNVLTPPVKPVAPLEGTPGCRGPGSYRKGFPRGTLFHPAMPASAAPPGSWCPV